MTEKIRGFEVARGWENIKPNLPKRQTKNSAGYDFEAIENITIPSFWKLLFNEVIDYIRFGGELKAIKPTLLHTGIKAYMQEDEVLIMANRSSNPIKRGLILTNGVGIVDSDYYNNPDNDGEIMFQFYNFLPFDIKINKGDRVGQGLFQKFLKVDNDLSTGKRLGGHGSSGVS